jgi:hypothetical protein
MYIFIIHVQGPFTSFVLGHVYGSLWMMLLIALHLRLYT